MRESKTARISAGAKRQPRHGETTKTGRSMRAAGARDHEPFGTKAIVFPLSQGGALAPQNFSGAAGAFRSGDVPPIMILSLRLSRRAGGIGFLFLSFPRGHSRTSKFFEDIQIFFNPGFFSAIFFMAMPFFFELKKRRTFGTKLAPKNDVSFLPLIL